MSWLHGWEAGKLLGELWPQPKMNSHIYETFWAANWGAHWMTSTHIHEHSMSVFGQEHVLGFMTHHRLCAPRARKRTGNWDLSRAPRTQPPCGGVSRRAADRCEPARLHLWDDARLKSHLRSLRPRDELVGRTLLLREWPLSAVSLIRFVTN